MSLRDLDDRLVPRLAAALDRLVRLVPKRSPAPAAGPASLIVRLRRLDDRWTARGPLAVLREVPQLGAVVIAALVLTSGVTVRSRDRPATQASEDGPAGEDAEELGDGTLGPAIGDSVPGYVVETRARLNRVAPGQPDGVVLAVVQFSRYVTPEQARTLLGPMQARRVFHRLPVKDGVTGTVDVEDLVADTRREFGRLATDNAAEARELRKVAKTIDNDPAQKREHEKDAALRDRDARLLRGECRCVFAVVVRAQLRLLLDALRTSGIRAIDISDVGADLEDFDQITALQPEETQTVTHGNQE